MTTVLRLGEEDVPEVTRVLCEAFYDYPVMRYVLGGHADDYEGRLSTLIHFFVMERVLRNEKLLGTMDGEGLAATALVSYPGRRKAPAELLALRDEAWDEFGPRVTITLRGLWHGMRPVRGRGFHTSTST